MKKIILLGFTIMVMSSLFSIAQSSKPAAQSSVSAKVEAYYFHMSTRCITCKAVEAEAKKNLESLYGEKVKFQAINLEDDANKAIVDGSILSIRETASLTHYCTFLLS